MRIEMRKAERIANGLEVEADIIYVPWWKRTLLHLFPRHSKDGDNSSIREAKRGDNRRVRTEMIRRMDEAPKLVTPSGFLSEGRLPTVQESPQVENKFSANYRQPSSPSPTRQLGLTDLPMIEHPDSNQISDLNFEDEDDDPVEDQMADRLGVDSRYCG
jgi:hypothetical protein